MKMYKLALMLLALVLMSAGLPASADDAAVEAADEVEDVEAKEDTILGTWYAQIAEDDALPAGDMFKLTFKEGGKATSSMQMGDYKREESWNYVHDKEKATLTLFELDDEGTPDEEPEVVLRYSFVDDMLIFRYTESDDAEEEDFQTMELTRNAEGTKRHQKLRKAAAEERDAGDEIEEIEDAVEDALEAVEEKEG